MTRPSPLALLGGCLLTLFRVGVTPAHDILLLPGEDPRAVRFSVKHGHPGDYSLPEREKLFVLDGYPADGGAPVSLLSRLDPSRPGDLVLTVGSDPGRPAAADVGGYGLLGARFDNGYFVEVDAEHYYNTSRRELPNAKRSGHYLKFAKALLPVRPDHAGFDRVLGYRLELVPKQDPFTLKPGDELTVQALFEGRPFAGAEIDVISGEPPAAKGAELPRFKADADGIARVRLERPGLQSIGTDRTVTPSADPALADEDNLASTLTFRLPAQP